MLKELRIENFAIIDKLDLEFGPGLVTFTGETGAGKSIIVDAVETLLGVRADSTNLRSGVKRSSVEGTFQIVPTVRDNVHTILQREDLLDDPEYVVLRREFRREGRNVARVNGRTVNLSLLGELGELLIDLHGQSEHLSLLRVKNHLALLDRFAEADALLAHYREHYEQWLALQKELTTLRQAEKDAAKQAELLAFQVDEIGTAGLKADEEDSLKEERTRLANAENLANLVNEALEALDESPMEGASASDRLGVAVSALNQLVKVDPSQSQVDAKATELFDGLTDLAKELRGYLDGLEFNPTRLEEVEERLDLFFNLKRKYGETIPEILAYAEKAQAELDAITHAEERIAELEMEKEPLLNALAEKGETLSARRKGAAQRLKAAIENELNDLRMSDAHFEVNFKIKEDPDGLALASGEKVAFDSNGLEGVEFLVAPNPGEGLKPLVKIASGGETSRLMLAMKNVLARADRTPTLIFDEIDQGIGGRVGAIVGHKLWSLARRHQVFCITHLPQLAGFGEQHFNVHKVVEGGRTITQVKRLKGKTRLEELALMLGEVSEGTLQSANEILETVSKETSAAAK